MLIDQTLKVWVTLKDHVQLRLATKSPNALPSYLIFLVISTDLLERWENFVSGKQTADDKDSHI